MAATMPSGGGGRRGGQIISGINVTPLVDVVLVLLIILMVSSTYIVAQTLKVQLPKTKSTDGQADKPTTIVVSKTGQLMLDEKPASEADVTAKLKQVIAADPDANIVVSADKDTAHGQVVHIMDLCKEAGVTKFAINVQTE
jgi:biopolymer transport protein ExbD